MILIAGVPTESPVRMVIEAAEAAAIPHVIFNQHEAHTYELSVSCVNNELKGLLHIAGMDCKLEDFDGAFVRIMEYQLLPERVVGSKQYVGAKAADKSGLIHQYLLHWMDVAPNRILNRPKNSISNLSKPYQAQLIAKCGLKVPATCITNDVNIAMTFKKKMGNVVYKSISSSRSIVKELDGVSMLQLERIKYLPTQFQQTLKGANIRVHVVGDQYFATRAATEIVDYRYADKEGGSLELSAFVLPDEIADKCYALSRALDLPLCGIDLFLTEDGDYYCFEVNPSPGYSFFQGATGQNIAGAIVRWLAFGTA